MKIAIEGCAHGELETIYKTIELLEQKENIKVDLLLCCGDFQCARNPSDLQCMAMPKKYQNMRSFYKYYNGELRAPILTLFIGGNHEASNYLQELPYGGWVAPNIYYLGTAGVVEVGGVRIGGMSGIYKDRDYMRGRHEVPPYGEDSKRSVYHYRNLDVFRLKQISQERRLDIFVSHDWPEGVWKHGDASQLIRFKPHFKDDLESGKLGSKPCKELLDILKPTYWFAAHLHCKFAAKVPHENGAETKFLALDKCLPQRRFLQIIDFKRDDSNDKPQQPISVEYDVEWLTILRITNHLLSTKNCVVYMPGPNGKERWNFTPGEEEKEVTRLRMDKVTKLLAENFVKTAPAFTGDETEVRNASSLPLPLANRQTIEFCKIFGVDDPLQILLNINESLVRDALEKEEKDDKEGEEKEEKEDVKEDESSSSGKLPELMSLKRLKLPEPKNVDLDEKISEKVVEKNDQITEEEKDSVEENSEENTSVNKIFKRRNCALYGNSTEEAS